MGIESRCRVSSEFMTNWGHNRTPSLDFFSSGGLDFADILFLRARLDDTGEDPRGGGVLLRPDVNLLGESGGDVAWEELDRAWSASTEWSTPVSTTGAGAGGVATGAAEGSVGWLGAKTSSNALVRGRPFPLPWVSGRGLASDITPKVLSKLNELVEGGGGKAGKLFDNTGARATGGGTKAPLVKGGTPVGKTAGVTRGIGSPKSKESSNLDWNLTSP